MHFSKRILIYTAFITTLMVSFLFAPEPEEVQGPQKYCPVKYIHLNKRMGFVMNCDAIEFLGSSVKPQLLFEKNYSRQSRPLYILTGSALGYIIYYLDSPLHGWMESHAKGLFQDRIPQEKISLYVSHYAGLILLNLLLLILAVYLFEKIVAQFSGGGKNGAWLRLSFGILFLSSYVTKTFFWVPHQQLFSLLLPLTAIIFYANTAQWSINSKKLAGFSLLAGILLLFYGSFLLLLITMLLALLHELLKQGKGKAGMYLKPAGIILVCFSLPMVVWFTILKIRGIVFFSKEVEFFREFVWIKDAIFEKNKVFIDVVYEQTLTFLSTFGILIFPLMILIYSKIVTRYNRKRNRDYDNASMVRSTGVFPLIAVLIVLFCFSIGYYADRITYTCVPVILCYSAIILERQKLNSLQKISFLIISLLWHSYLILFEMPHFSSRIYY